MKYRCFIAALLLHILIGAVFFIPYKKTDKPYAVYIHAYLVTTSSSREAKRRNDPPPSLSFPRRRESSVFMAFLDPRFPPSPRLRWTSRKDDNKKQKNENKNNIENKSQATKLAIYLHDQIQQNLADANLPDSIQNQKIQIEFTLTNTGIIKNIKLQQSTGFKLIDQEIVNAIANISTIPSKLLLQQTQQFSLIVLTANNTI